MENTNIEELAFILTRHADDLQRFAYLLKEEELEEFDSLEAAIMEVVFTIYSYYEKNGIPVDASMDSFIKKIREQIRDIKEGYYEDLFESLSENLYEEVKNESKFLYKVFTLLPGVFAADRLLAEDYKNIFAKGVYNGNTVKLHLQDIQENEIKRIARVIMENLSGNFSIIDARNAVKKELEKVRKNITSAIDLFVNGVAADTAKAFAAKNRCFLLYSTALDSSVCENCSPLEGKMYSFDSPDLPAVPMHYNCRCRLVPVPANDPIYKDLSMNFSQYTEKLNEEERDSRLGGVVLGKNEYLMPHHGQGLSLQELKERDKEAFGFLT